MFAKIALPLLSVSALLSGVLAAPFKPTTQSPARRTDISFNNWGGFSSLSNFDNFYGLDNFDGSLSEQIIIQEEDVVVCESESIEIVQQRLVVLEEMAKRIILEQICDVETQTIVFEQFIASSSLFSSDLSRSSGFLPGYDSSIVSNFGNLVNSDGSLSTSDLGFSGSDVGKNTIVPSGSNWNDVTSPASVQNALNAAKSAAGLN